MENNKKKFSYDKDYIGWIFHQADLLRSRDFGNIDVNHLIEEMESLGNSEKDKLKSHLSLILMHLLKIKYLLNLYL